MEGRWESLFAKESGLSAERCVSAMYLL